MGESVLQLLLDARRAKQQGAAAIARRQRARLANLVTFARAHSPYYRALYQDLPERIADPAHLPVTNKPALMARFDDWVTDRAVTIEQVRAFVADLGRVGEPFLGKYLVATTSGTTGRPGIFLFDDRFLKVTTARQQLIFSTWLTPSETIRTVARGMRAAAVFATGGHYLGSAFATRYARDHPWLASRYRVFPVHMPLPELVAKLNQFRPAVLLGYASVVALLADERAAGRLRIDPILVVPTAEGLGAGEYRRIARVFGAKVRNLYAATEVGYATYGCRHGWHHVLGDWDILEPVDADYRPTSPGVQSHTVLVTNLANRVQPILRYDLGDSILQRPGPCPCGDPLPAIRAQGRTADVLTFPTTRGERVSIPPLVFDSLADRTPGVERLQIVQTTPTSLRVRLRPAAGAAPDDVWPAVSTVIARLLAEHGLGHVTVERAAEPPEQSPGGKFRPVIPLGAGVSTTP